MKLYRLAHDRRGAAASEFALILPVLLIFFLGIIDVGMWMWAHNRAEKATQAGARHAAVTDFVAADLMTTNFASEYNIPSGNSIPSETVAPITCGGSSCSSFGYDGAAFASILAAVRGQFPEITAANLLVRYTHVGLGYAGNPNGADISPVVTVEIVDNGASNRLFNPVFLDLFLPDGFNLTGVGASMTMEDGDGQSSFSA